jgi:hypothetical protein
VVVPDAFPEAQATVVRWRRDQVLDLNGMPLDTVPRPVLRELPFTLSPAELNLSQTVGELSQILEAGTTQQCWVSRSLLRSFQSSPAALDNALRRITDARDPGAQNIEAVLEPSEDDSVEEQFGGWLDLATAQKVAGIAARVITEMEAIRGDSKFDAFNGFVTHLTELRTPPSRICVFTEYLATLFYLAAEIESLGHTCHVFHGGMDAESRRSSLALFSEGGILMSTRVALSGGVALYEVTDLILYDVPGSKFTLQQILGRFDRLGRRTQLSVYPR